MKTNHVRGFVEPYRPKSPNKYWYQGVNEFADEPLEVHYREGAGHHQAARAKRGMKDALHRMRRRQDKEALRKELE